MSVSDQSGIARNAELPTLRLYLGGAAEELRAISVELSMLTIGRRPYNDLPLDDLTVSGEHALLRRRNGEFVIYDLNSRNGTLVNGLPIQHRVLADGDVIDIGIYRLRFEAPAPVSAGAGASQSSAGDDAPRPTDDDAPRPADASVARAVADRPPSAGAESMPLRERQSPRSETPSPPSDSGSSGAEPESPTVERRSGDRRGSERRAGDRRAASRRAADRGDPAGSGRWPTAAPGPMAAGAPDLGSTLASVEHLNGPQAGQRQLLERTINRIGGAAAQVAVISRRKGGYFITHLEGLTFPQVNGELIGLNAHRLSDGDLIELAGAMLRFRRGS